MIRLASTLSLCLFLAGCGLRTYDHTTHSPTGARESYHVCIIDNLFDSKSEGVSLTLPDKTTLTIRATERKPDANAIAMLQSLGKDLLGAVAVFLKFVGVP